MRCMLMTTDPGDLVLDPTCGAGTTAYVAEEWGRRWITMDSSRIALNLAKQRILTATLSLLRLHDEDGGDIRQGFVYETAKHVMLGQIAKEEPPEEEVLYDKPKEDRDRLRVAGPFTVETLQSYEPVSPEALDATSPTTRTPADSRSASSSTSRAPGSRTASARSRPCSPAWTGSPTRASTPRASTPTPAATSARRTSTSAPASGA